MWSAKYSVALKTSQWPLAQAMRMCKLYVLFTRRRQAPLIYRRRVAPHLRWRELRWQSFTTWRWAGPALAGWIRCQWITRRLPLLPRRRHRTTWKIRRHGPAEDPHRGESPPRNRPANRAVAPPRSLLPVSARRNPARSPANEAAGSPPESLPRKVDAGRQGRALGEARRAGLQLARALGALPDVSRQRKDGEAGDARLPAHPCFSRRASAAAQLISAM